MSFVRDQTKLYLSCETNGVGPNPLSVLVSLSAFDNFFSNLYADLDFGWIQAYVRNFGDKDGKVWQGGGGRNPPPEAPHLVMTTPEIESLRPKSPMKNQQQLQQQQSTSISLTTANSSNRRPAGNSPSTPGALGLNQEASSSNPSTPAPWASPLEGFRGREGSVMPADDKVFDMYGYGGQANQDYQDFESQRQMNLL